mmetsp:Transcript_19639/g.49637  ORF Transcript_19639/g.49637 Transcript_19639/m.49637 type:complete len:237 (-) Transcript_19639:881-1591(-)
MPPSARNAASVRCSRLSACFRFTPWSSISSAIRGLPGLISWQRASTAALPPSAACLAIMQSVACSSATGASKSFSSARSRAARRAPSGLPSLAAARRRGRFRPALAAVSSAGSSASSRAMMKLAASRNMRGVGTASVASWNISSAASSALLTESALPWRNSKRMRPSQHRSAAPSCGTLSLLVASRHIEEITSWARGPTRDPRNGSSASQISRRSSNEPGSATTAFLSTICRSFPL